MKLHSGLKIFCTKITNFAKTMSSFHFCAKKMATIDFWCQKRRKGHLICENLVKSTFCIFYAGIATLKKGCGQKWNFLMDFFFGLLW